MSSHDNSFFANSAALLIKSWALKAVTDHGIEPRRLLAILLTRPMCERKAVNLRYHSIKRAVKKRINVFSQPQLLY
jgi:hypothetical protein